MALTPAGGTSAYAQPSDLFFRYDIREIADYLSDTGARTGGSPNPNSTILATNANLIGLLKEASGVFEASVMRSQRYQLVDIQAMLAQVDGSGQPGNGGQVIIGIVCGWAMFLLWQRRPTRYLQKELPVGAQQALEMMKALSSGEQILPFLEAEIAGLPEMQIESPSDVDARNLTTRIARRFFGTRQNQYPQPPRG